MIRCPECGAGAGDDAERCARCGWDLKGEIAFLVPDDDQIEDPPAAIVESPPRTGALLALAAVGAAILAALVLPGGGANDADEGTIDEAAPTTPTTARRFWPVTPPDGSVRPIPRLLGLEPGVEPTGDTAPELAGHRLAVVISDHLWLIDAETGAATEVPVGFEPVSWWTRPGYAVLHGNRAGTRLVRDEVRDEPQGSGLVSMSGTEGAWAYPDPVADAAWVISAEPDHFSVRELDLVTLALRENRVVRHDLVSPTPLAVSEAGILARDGSGDYFVVGSGGSLPLPTTAQEPAPFALRGRLLALADRTCPSEPHDPGGDAGRVGPCRVHIVDLVTGDERVAEVPGRVEGFGFTGVFSWDASRLAVLLPGNRPTVAVIDVATSAVTDLGFFGFVALSWSLDDRWLFSVTLVARTDERDIQPAWQVHACPVATPPCHLHRVALPFDLTAPGPQSIGVRPTAAPDPP